MPQRGRPRTAVLEALEDFFARREVHVRQLLGHYQKRVTQRRNRLSKQLGRADEPLNWELRGAGFGGLPHRYHDRDEAREED